MGYIAQELPRPSDYEVDLRVIALERWFGIEGRMKAKEARLRYECGWRSVRYAPPSRNPFLSR